MMPLYLTSFILSLGCWIVQCDLPLFAEFVPFLDPVPYPEIIDMRLGGTLEMIIGETREHYWGGGLTKKGWSYGYGQNGKPITYPGPTILTAKGVGISIRWTNNLTSPHMFDEHVEPSLLMDPGLCYPQCGIPVITHMHGLEVPDIYDGNPLLSITQNQSKLDFYSNTQLGATYIYHDHGIGFTRLNAWAGLAGGYVIEDPAEELLGVTSSFDRLLIITDKLIDIEGNVLYTPSQCTAAQTTNWVSEQYGTINLVNGVVFPYVSVPRQVVRLRLVNAANARHYWLNMPFASLCRVIAKESSFLQRPVPLEANESNPYVFFGFQRMELLCDFSNVALNTVWNVTDTFPITADDFVGGAANIFQLRVDSEGDGVTRTPLADQLISFKDFKTEWESSGGATRRVELNEVEDSTGCPAVLYFEESDVVENFLDGGKIFCESGKVEKWYMANGTPDIHPIHWHVVSAQCGLTDDTIDTNSILNVYPVPNDRGDMDLPMSICYVACMPIESMVTDSTRGPNDWGFDISVPYLIHCHILEHEENTMMSFFQILAPVQAQAEKKAQVSSLVIVGAAAGGFALVTLACMMISLSTRDKGHKQAKTEADGVDSECAGVTAVENCLHQQRSKEAAASKGGSAASKEGSAAPKGGSAACDSDSEETGLLSQSLLHN